MHSITIKLLANTHIRQELLHTPLLLTKAYDNVYKHSHYSLLKMRK